MPLMLYLEGLVCHSEHLVVEDDAVALFFIGL